MKKLISDRWDVIKELVVGRSVLDLGCVDHEASRSEDEHWLHRKIAGEALETLGVDRAEEEVKRLQALGYQVVQGDVEKLDLGRRFDVVVAGNIIEHLSNPGLLLESVKKHLKPDGLFVLTTDNCYGLRSLKAVAFLDGIRPNQEHTVTFEEEVLRQLLRRHGFEVLDFYYYNGPYRSPLKKWLIDSLCRMRKSWAWQMLAVVRQAAPLR
jgi:SAM-dependent methyltransferase